MRKQVSRGPGIHSRGRRRFLTLAASGVVGGLVLRLDREARGQLSTQPRFVLYNHCNGLQNFHLEKSTVRSPRDFDLASFMKRFEPHKAELTVVQNLFCSPGEYLHGNASSALSCAERNVTDGGSGISEMIVGGPTIDQVIADHLIQQERLRTVVLGHPINLNNGNCVQGTIIGRDKDEPVYPTIDPMKAHELIFGVSGQNEVLKELEQSYLDFLKDDIQSFQTELPAAEGQKLEQYLESVREIERALAGGGAGQCPDLEAQQFDVREGATDNNPEFWRYMCDLGVAALQCGATRQVTMLHTYGCIHFRYTFDGVTRNHHEDVAHTDEQGSFMERILDFHAENVAYMFQKLKDIPEGNGSMADTLLFAWMSDGGGLHHNGNRSHPMIFLGQGNGQLNSGQWIQYEQDRYALACSHVTAARAMGLDLDTFGDGKDPCNGPLPELIG